MQNFTVAHVQFGHPGVNLRPRLAARTLVPRRVSFDRLRVFRDPIGCVLARVAPGLGAAVPLRVSVRAPSQHGAAAVAVGGRAAGDHGAARSLGAATQARSRLLALGGGRGDDGTSEHPVNTFIATGPAPGHVQTKHAC